jgi:iron complex outermembrane recepter protein
MRTILRFTPALPCAVICLWSVATAAGQQAPAPSPSGQLPEQETVHLTPFEVVSEADVGYTATNTMAGSRLNTALKDTPASISVLTSEFLSDIGAFQLEEALAYAVNIEFDLDETREAVTNNGVFQSYQSYRTRGLDASRSRNYFSGSRAPDEMALLDRIEDSRGPNSVLFGIGSPGGTINASTKQAQVGRAFQRGSFTFGSYNSRRGTIDVNQPLLDRKLAFRLNLVYNKNNTFRHWAHRDDKRAHLTARYQLTDRTRIRMEFERGQVVDNSPVSFNLLDNYSVWDAAGRPTFANQAANAALGVARRATGAAAVRVTYIEPSGKTISMRGTMTTNTPDGGVVSDRNLVDYSVHHGGPAQNRYSRFGEFSAFFEHQLGRNTFIELGFNHSEHSFDNRDPRGARRQLLGDPNQFYNDGTPNPFAGQLLLEAQWFRTTRWDLSDTGRASFSHTQDAGKWGNYRFGTFAEYDKGFTLSTTYREVWVDAVTRLPAFNPVPDNTNNDVYRISYPTPGDWPSWHVNGPVGSGGLLSNVTDPVTGRTLSSMWQRQGGPTETYSTKKSGMVVTQARYFGGRLILAGGLRRDEYDEYQPGRRRNPETQVLEVARDPATANVAAPTANSAIGRTRTMGAVYHVPLPERWRGTELSLFYNQANNVAVPSRGNTMLHPSGDPTLDPVPVTKPEGKGNDFGVGLSLLENKLYLKGTVYKTEGADQSTTSPTAVRTSNARILETLHAQGLITQQDLDRRTDLGNQGLFGHQSKGYEFQVTGNPTRSWRLQASYARATPIENYRFPEWIRWEAINRQYLVQFNQNIVLPNARTIAQELEFIHDELAVHQAAIGIGKLGNRKHKVSLFTRYDFRSGWLKNVYVGGGYRHQSKMFVGVRNDNNQLLYGNSYWYADALAGYTVPGLRKGRKLSFQLNVLNVFNERDPLILRYVTGAYDRTLRESIRPPTTWRLTTNFEY